MKGDKDDMAVMSTILLVDGCEDVAKIREGLESCDGAYAVDCARDASECERYLGQTRPDLILLAVTLPDMDGFALRAKLKLTDARDIPVIYLADKCDFETTRTTGMLTADDFIVKPINVHELLLRIRKALTWRCLRTRGVRRPRRGGRPRKTPRPGAS
jgi:DNA-binding response OmpR family regulator